MERPPEPPRRNARLAGLLYLARLLTAIIGEFVVHGTFGIDH
jgi:hypothetical protein